MGPTLSSYLLYRPASLDESGVVKAGIIRLEHHRQLIPNHVPVKQWQRVPPFRNPFVLLREVLL